jgi:hypothetical protein
MMYFWCFPYVTGFLVCVPMLEEWKSGDGIEVLDGWTFQVYYFIPSDIGGHHIAFIRAVFIRVSMPLRVPRNDTEPHRLLLVHTFISKMTRCTASFT